MSESTKKIAVLRPEPSADALDRTIAALWATGDEFGLHIEAGQTRIGFSDGGDGVGYAHGELRVQPD